MGACESSRNAANLSEDVTSLIKPNTTVYECKDGEWIKGKILEPLESSRIKCKFNEEEKILDAESSSVIVEIWRNAPPKTWAVAVVEYWWKNHNRENDTIQKYSHLVEREELVGEALMAESFDRAFLKECGVPFGTAISIIKGRDELNKMHNESDQQLPQNANAESYKLPDDASFAVLKLKGGSGVSISSDIPVSANMALSNNGLQELRQGDDDESAGGSSSSDDGEGFNFQIGGGPSPPSRNSQPANPGEDAIYGNFANIALQKMENYASTDDNYASFDNVQQSNPELQESRMPQNSKPPASVNDDANSDQEEESSDMPAGFSVGGMLTDNSTVITSNSQPGLNQNSLYANISEMLPDQSMQSNYGPASNFQLEQSNTVAMNTASNEDLELQASSVLPTPPVLKPDVSTMAPDRGLRGPSASQATTTTEIMDGKYYPNQEVEVLSATSEAWVLARVHGVKDGIVTVKYMDRQKELREDSTKIRLPKQTLNINGIEYIKNDFENLSWRLKESLKSNDMIKTKRIYLKQYQDVFSGADAIEILSGLEAIDKREDAELLAAELQREQAFYAVPKKNKDFVNSKKSFYKFDDDKEAKHDTYFQTLEYKRKHHKPKRKEWTRPRTGIECCVRNNRQELQWVQAAIEGYDQERDVIYVKPTKLEHRGAQRPWYDRYSDLLRPLSRPSRDQWSDGQELKIYSKSKNKWMDGKIIQIYKSYVRVAYENQSKWMERESIKLRTD